MTMLTWLADCLREAGLQVVEEPEWKTRGHGEMGTSVVGVLLHHTAGPLHGDDPSLGIVEQGRPDLAGPLAQLFLSRSGVYHVVAAGKCWHAGKGSWHGVADGNSQFIGIEAENSGTLQDPWPQPQMQAYLKGVAALLEYLKRDDVWAVGHKEYALPKGRKVDPSFDMVDFRTHLESLMHTGVTPSVTAVQPTDIRRSMLRKGDQGDSVKILQHRLGIKEDGFFGPATDTAVREFQKKNGLKVDGLVGPQTWIKLGE